jgi:pimeloyl-ACP methyl ester carboxylesterase
VSAAQWFGRIYPNNQTHIYKGIGHLPMEETAEQSASDVRAWLAKNSASG